MFNIVKVRGESMRPTLAPGDYLIVTKARSVRPGLVVWADHPKYGRIVKRVVSVGDGTIRLAGDGPESTDEDAMGDVEVSRILGRAHWAVTPEGIRRL